MPSLKVFPYGMGPKYILCRFTLILLLAFVTIVSFYCCYSSYWFSFFVSYASSISSLLSNLGGEFFPSFPCLLDLSQTLLSLILLTAGCVARCAIYGAILIFGIVVVRVVHHIVYYLWQRPLYRHLFGVSYESTRHPYLRILDAFGDDSRLGLKGFLECPKTIGTSRSTLRIEENCQNEKGGEFEDNNVCDNHENNQNLPLHKLIYLGANLDARHIVMISDPDAFQQILCNEKKFIKNRATYDGLQLLIGKGLVCTAGAQWSRQRKLLTPLFHFGILKEYTPIIIDNVLQFVAKMKREARKHQLPNETTVPPPSFAICSTSLSTETGGSIPVYRGKADLEELALYTIIDCIFGGDFEKQEMYASWQEMTRRFPQIFLLVIALGLWSTYVTPLPSSFRYWRARRKAVRQVNDLIQRERQKHRERKCHLAETEGGDGELEATKKKTLENKTGTGGMKLKKPEGLIGWMIETADVPNHEIVDQCLTFLFAGHDTMANVLSWSFFLLATNPTKQKCAQKELDAIFPSPSFKIEGKEGTEVEFYPSSEDIAKLDYVRGILKEALRLFPPVPTLERISTVDFKVDGVTIPRNACLFLNFYAVHRDSRYWKDPLDFLPERWLIDSSSAATSPRADVTDSASSPSVNVFNHPFAYAPFSSGPRNCIGQKFALLEGSICLALILKSFDVSLACRPEDIQMAIVGTMGPVNLKLKFTLRQSY